MSILEFLNLNSGFVQSFATVILVGVTAFYAIQTRKMNKLIGMQIFPQIFIKPYNLTSSLFNPEFIANIKNAILDKNPNKNFVIYFYLNYGVFNHSASYGSIERPQLLIENPRSGNKKLLLPDIESVVMSTSCKGEIKNTIYMNAGEMKNIKEEFKVYISANNPLADVVDFINNVSSLQFTVFYKNVAGQQLSIILGKEQVNNK